MPNQLDLPIQPDTPAADPARDAEREAYRARLAEYLRDPAFRAIEGFPIGEDEDILALSDPPYYTACPNPFLPEIIEGWREERDAIRQELGLPTGEDEDYHREPYASDVSEGKNNPIYNAHSYHTKVPHKAIMRYILHYTEPGDIVLDGFCGTGMTGVAAQLCGDRAAVQELGYIVDDEGVVWEDGKAVSRLGARKAVLNDLSPAATFIAYNYNTPVDAAAFEREANRILREVEEECGWMYETWHPHCDDPGRVKGKINYTVWSDVFLCPNCGRELVYYGVALDDEGSVQSRFECPDCSGLLNKRQLAHAQESYFDPLLGRSMTQNKQVPVMISYTAGRKRYAKIPDKEDFDTIAKAEQSKSALSGAAITHPMLLRGGTEWGTIWRSGYHKGITHSHHFYSRRNFHIVSVLWQKAKAPHLRWTITGILNYVNRKQSYTGGGGGMPGVLYIASLVQEKNVFEVVRRKLRRITKVFSDYLPRREISAIATRSSTELAEPLSRSVDYVFVDPPFGGNIMYSEGSFLWESLLSVFTNQRTEAITSPFYGKGLREYQRAMQQCFRSFHKGLKPGGWMTVEFHNSQNSVWNAIQESLQLVGFVIADVRTLDKKQGSFKQVTSSGAVRQDLIISAYKPTTEMETTFQRQAGTPEGAWAFVRQHLAQVPVVAQEDGAIESLAERRDYLLYDRMVAYHLTRGATVPLSAAEFYAGLRERFAQRDGMFFTADQVAEYDRARMAGAVVRQLALFVNDEKSAIQWLRQLLDASSGGRARSYQEIQPEFLQQLHQASHEALPELRDLLEQNFLQDEAGRWYPADATRAGDLERLRTRALLREFAEYAEGGKRLRQFRSEAVRAGFAHCYKERDWATIVAVAERLPRRALEEDPDLLMYYDNASLMAG